MTRKTNKPKQANPGRPASAPAQPLTSEQRARLLLADERPGLDGEIEMQRQANQRLQDLWDALQHDKEPDAALQVKVAAALTTGTGRVARLLRDQRALTGEAADGLTAAVARALEELSTELGVAS
jgi:hypothetical protein